jgi:LysM repeat protein
MKSRPSSTFVFALALSLATPALLSHAQTAAPADASSAAPTPAAPAPAPAVTPAPAPVEPTTPTERPTSYTMEAGDSLDSIAKKFDTSIKALAKLNHIDKSQYKKLRAGKVLQIPPAKVEAPAK